MSAVEVTLRAVLVAAIAFLIAWLIGFPPAIDFGARTVQPTPVVKHVPAPQAPAGAPIEDGVWRGPAHLRQHGPAVLPA